MIDKTATVPLIEDIDNDGILAPRAVEKRNLADMAQADTEKLGEIARRMGFDFS